MHKVITAYWRGIIFKSLTPTFRSSSPTMLSADILADVVRGVPVRPSPKKNQIRVGEHVIIRYVHIATFTVVGSIIYSPRRILEGGGVAKELMGLEGVTGMGGRSAASLPRLLDGRLSF